ncbi:choline sulfate utilization transcriptional regulator [Rhizobium paknamense]|uniref:Choline sulfate-utilization transcription factor n=1 Tax=Rhizobium paknamense TaxID=1206817 RepID=A0ABU0ICA9_9HYPH|nr:LysR family transcriptional regulator [Rhizobium paknamense]MDQ0455302.1 putative choline sulfate-utilization transcription factor [Rhizobium paknamense]
MAERALDLGWMRVFREVGRLKTLSAAAESLGLSQPAVSYQIRQLEEALGVGLLIRQHRGVSLTDEGQQLFEAVSKAVEDMDALAANFRARRERPVLRVKTDYAFSSLWLMPRMQIFRDAHPDMDIQIVATQRTQHNLSEAGEVAVVFGTAEEFASHGTLLLPERVVPVCSPGWFTRHGTLDDPAGTPHPEGPRLLHLDVERAAPWFDWAAYFDATGLRPAAGIAVGELRFNTYALVVQAAIAEQGVALGWMGLVDELLAAGLLVKAGPQVEKAGRGYWLLPPRQRSAGADHLCAWLRSQFTGSG